MTLSPQHHDPPAEVTPGNSPPCRGDCPARELCLTCGEPLCPAHDRTNVVECAEGGWHCDDECHLTCLPCDRAAWDDELGERADRARKEPWD